MQKIDINQLQQIISKLKLKKPSTNLIKQSSKQINVYYSSKDFSFSKQEQSIVQDNYQDSNCFPFYQNQLQKREFQLQYKKEQQKIKPQHKNFDSIIDKLKTQGDQQNQFFSNQIQSTLIGQMKKSSNKHSLISQYELKPHAKSYKNINSTKKKYLAQCKNANLQFISEKQNVFINSNNFNMTSLNKNKMTKTFFYKNKTDKKGSKNNEIGLQSQLKVKTQLKNKQRSIQSYEKQSKASSPFSFKYTKIEPHKFSSYKMKLF